MSEEFYVCRSCGEKIYGGGFAPCPRCGTNREVRPSKQKVCPHDWRHSVEAVEVDGLCPLCMQDEIERLRAALKQIVAKQVTIGVNGNPLLGCLAQDMRDIAREALRGAVETTAKPSEFTDAQLEQHAEAMGWSSKACAHPVGSYVCPTCGVHVTSESETDDAGI